MKVRQKYIDHLRGLAMLLMIGNHLSAYYLDHPLAKIIWDVGEISVPLFIFCSVASFRVSFDRHLFSWSKYIAKRVKRLLIPYYIYLCFEAIRIIIQDKNPINLRWIWGNLTLTGGLDLNWLVLLFLYLLFLIPILTKWYLSKSKLFWVVMGVSLSVSTLSLFVDLAPYSRLVMGFGWSLIVGWSLLILDESIIHQTKIVLWAIVAIIFGSIFTYVVQTGGKTFQYDHKYPPDIFHIFWGIILMSIIIALMRKWDLKNIFVSQFLIFFSLYSYPIYFIHNLIIKVWFSYR